MRALLVAAASSTTGGGERHVADLLRTLPALGVDCALAYPGGGDLGDLARSLGIPVTEVPIAAGFGLARVRALRAAIAALDPDVVHAHGSRAAFFARLADPRAATRVVYTLHGIHVDRSGSAARRASFLTLERRLVSRTAHFVAVCASDAEKGARLRVLERSRTTVVHNGIASPDPVAPGLFRAELGVSSDVPLALSVGRFHAQKDQPTLLRAWSEVRSATPGAVLALVGSGELEGELRSLADSLGLADGVRFVTPRPDLAPAYADADLFVLSSAWEGFPYVVLEAMGHGDPVVSTAVDGIPEAVEDGVSGLLAPPGDPRALAAAVTRVLSEPDLAARLGGAARTVVAERFSLARMAEGVLNVYRVVAAGTQRS